MTSKNNNPHTEPEDKKDNVSPSAPEKTDNQDSGSQKQPDSSVKQTAGQNSHSGKSAASTAKTVSDSKPSAPQGIAEPAKGFEEKQGKRGVKLGTVAIILFILFGGGLAFQMHQKDQAYQAQILALQSQLSETRNQVSSQLDESRQQTIAKTTEITHKAEVVLDQQQKSITSLQLAIADIKGRRPNDWLLAEADYLAKLAGRKLFLEHDVVSATLLMESADQRIASLNDPSLVPLRKAMAEDITKLKSIPLVDRDGLVLRLISLQEQVDSLPLANALLPDAEPEETVEVSEDINNWQQNLMASLKGFADSFITFRTRDGNVVPLLSPEQHFYLRENLIAKLETAIKSVYDEQQAIYDSSLKTALKWSASYLNQDDNSVKQFNKTLQQLSDIKITVNYPVKLNSQKQLADVINERLRREVTSMTTEEK